LDLSGSVQGPVEGFCEDGNEPFRSLKRGEYLNELGDYQFLGKDSSPCS